MDVSDLLATESPFSMNGRGNHAISRPSHAYPTRHASSTYGIQVQGSNMSDLDNNVHGNGFGSYGESRPPSARKAPKTVNFQLLLSGSPNHRARLPLRINIQAHDSTDNIIATVKNFYGLYEGQGVSFEDANGVTLIAQYENLEQNTTVYVRITSEQSDTQNGLGRRSITSGSPRKHRLEEPFQMFPPQPYSRPHSRTAKKRSPSPSLTLGYRSMSARAQSKLKSRHGNSPEMIDDHDVANGLSDSDAGSVSVSSSRRAKSDLVASADISLDNIVEGGRRKRAKFESSELPLFAPPQQPMPTSISSLSPQRRLTNSNIQSPIAFNNQYTFAYSAPLPSPQSATGFQNDIGTLHRKGNGIQQDDKSYRRRPRAMSGYNVSRPAAGHIPTLLPTPDPTIGSVISDEDVALQLMRLGDASNVSHGRTSTSTLDDALSGKAEGASSEDETDEESGGEHDSLPRVNINKASHIAAPQRKRQKIAPNTSLPTFESADTSGDDYDDRMDSSFKGDSDGLMPDVLQSVERIKPKLKNKLSTSSVPTKIQMRDRAMSMTNPKSKASPGGKIPTSPYSMPAPARKASTSSAVNFQYQLGPDEDDLSSKPRCQRCRKSKKGCDRQRPCQRCKDAGIGIEGCVSEDEGNGRKGRYGRHMGVPVKRDSQEPPDTFENPIKVVNGYFPETTTDAGKKRKR